MDGWIKTFRKLQENPVFDNEDACLLKMWIWLLLNASHKKHEIIVGRQKVTLEVGELIFGRRIASVKLRMPESKVYRLLKSIEKLEMIEIKPNNKFSIVKVVNFGFYQGISENLNSERTASEQQTDSKRTASEHKQECKNVKNEKEGKENSPVGLGGTVACPIPPGMSVEEYERRIREARE